MTSIKARLEFALQRAKISMLRNRIKRIENASYLSLWDRVELRNITGILNRLEKEYAQMTATHTVFAAR